MFKAVIFNVVLFGLGLLIKLTLRTKPAFKAEASKHNIVLQMKTKDNRYGRHFIFNNGSVNSVLGIHPSPDVAMVFKTLDIALLILNPSHTAADEVHAAKNFLMTVDGEDPIAAWALQLVNKLLFAGLKFGEPQKDGSTRYTTVTNGGPLFVYVRDGKLLRVTPIEFTDEDAASWTIKAKGKEFIPSRQTSAAPHAMSYKSTVTAENRILYPMKRVDYDPDGERNPQNRGISGYERISWDEALDLVAKEINRQKQEHGPGSIFFPTSSHHQWGNIGYYLSALTRFANLIGFTRMVMNPDSWEGWYWGAQHHYGNTMRVGASGAYGTMEDCLKEAEQIVFWSSDPESTNSAYAAFEGTKRRFWAQELGIKFVHIDPHYNATAQLIGGKWFPIKPTTDAAMAIAIMYVWLKEDLYDKEYVATRTTGFDEWADYLLGKEDGIEKNPEWQQGETGIPARDVRALARSWGNKKTYLAPGTGGTGFGGACRGSNGLQWARCMIQMMAMQGWGKPGVNMGNLQGGAPVDLEFYFPGYADGGISGDLNNTGNAVNNYQRMQHILTANPVKQLIPKQRIPEAIIEGKAEGYMWDPMSQEGQFAPFQYPMEGFSPIRMIYRYGGSIFSTATKSGRFVEAFRHKSIECIVNQSIFMEGETQFADIILPACSSLERWDIGEWASSGGYIHHSFDSLNHRVIAVQHKCIEPLGESKSDYQIFQDILGRLGLASVFTEGCDELGWVKRMFDSSDLPKHISWKKFLKKGYFVVPAEKEELRAPVNMRWFSEGRRKDVPEPHPLPSQFSSRYGHGLQTPSGKIEFVPTILKRAEKTNPERSALNRYIPSWEGPKVKELVDKYPLQMIATHSRYSFHTYSDGKGFTDQIKDHRVLIDGHYYWIVRMHSGDAAKRGLKQHDLVKVYNDRAIVICAVDIADTVTPGVMKSSEASSKFNLFEVMGETIDIGGCLNMLTPDRPQVAGTHSMSPNSTLVEIVKYEHVVALNAARAEKVQTA